jgi:hypothetical protein
MPDDRFGIEHYVIRLWQNSGTSHVFRVASLPAPA